jgi:hypothetical protein
MNDVESINADLVVATIVRKMEFSTDSQTGRCSVILEMVDDGRRPTAAIVAEAHGVSELKTQGFGGGITQMLCLRARYVGDLQHDRIRFVLEDLEDGRLFLKCEQLATKRLPANG